LKIIDKINGLIISKEYNSIVKIWNHKIVLRSIGEDILEYTDEVEIYAGILTFIVAIWGKMFYKHRQKKWIRIAKEL
jgi:hypothetical protein